MTNVLAPLEEPFSDEVNAALARYPRQNGYLLTLFRTFANSVRFLEKCVPNLLDKESPLDLRTREIIILRVTANRNCEYEWGVHVAIFSNAAGLRDDHIAATKVSNADCWSAKEQRLISAIDQLCEQGTVDNAALSIFQKDWTKEQQLEIIALCGTYSTIRMVANVARLPLENFAVAFPAKH